MESQQAVSANSHGQDSKLTAKPKFRGFGLIRLDKCISGPADGGSASPEREGNPHFYYRYAEHTMMGGYNKGEVTLDKFRRMIGKTKDKTVKMSEDRFFRLSNGNYEAVTEFEYHVLLKEWEENGNS